jgi:hypothetical protein
LRWVQVDLRGAVFDCLVARQFLHPAPPFVSLAATVQTLDGDGLDRARQTPMSLFSPQSIFSRDYDPNAIFYRFHYK